MKYDPTEVWELLNECDRDETIAFLAWNDLNGIFTDAQAEGEDMRPLTEMEAKLIAMRILWENCQAPPAIDDMLVAIVEAENFISGFEDDATQQGIGELLTKLRVLHPQYR